MDKWHPFLLERGGGMLVFWMFNLWVIFCWDVSGSLGRFSGAGLGEGLELPWRQRESLGARQLSLWVFRVLESDLQCFERHQAHGLLGKLHGTVGVHQDLDGPRRLAPALQHLEEAERALLGFPHTAGPQPVCAEWPDGDRTAAMG